MKNVGTSHLMVEAVLDFLSAFLFLVGGLLVVVGALGILRFPDFYTRLHAVGVTDTFGADLILLAMVLQANDFLVAVKLCIAFIFILMTSPVSTHAIAHAAYAGRMRPMLGPELQHPETDREMMGYAAVRDRGVS